MVVPVARLRRLVWGGIAACAALHVVYAVSWVRWGEDAAGIGVLAFFDLDRESSVPTAFAVLLLGLGAALLEVAGTADGPRRRTWRLAAGVAGALAAGEVVTVHEWVGERLHALLDTDGALYLAWVVPGAVAVLVLAVALRTFVRSIDRRVGSALVLAAGLYVTGAIGCEVLASLHYAGGGTTRAARYQALVLVEETLELAGAATLVVGVGRHLARTGVRVEVAFEREPVQTGGTDASTSATAATSAGTRS